MTRPNTVSRPDALPDPMTQPEFYEGVMLKRGLAWVIDVILITAMTVAAGVLTAGLGLLLFGLFYTVISFTYRTLTLTGGGTLGMRFFGVELRGVDGFHLSKPEAAVHTLCYFVTMPFALINIAVMFLTERGQSLPDLLVGSVGINRPR